MKENNIKSPSKATRSDEDLWVDVHDDERMISLGIRLPLFSPRDKSVWSKTPNEKRLLKQVRTNKEKIHFNISPRKIIPVKSRLIVYLKKNKKFPNTTYSTECWQHEIGDILVKYRSHNKNTGKDENLVSKYVYNGKTYSPEKRPFWP